MTAKTLAPLTKADTDRLYCHERWDTKERIYQVTDERWAWLEGMAREGFCIVLSQDYRGGVVRLTRHSGGKRQDYATTSTCTAGIGGAIDNLRTRLRSVTIPPAAVPAHVCRNAGVWTVE